MKDVKHVAGRLDRYSTVGDLLANEQSRAVLHQALGAEMFQNPAMGMVMGQPLLALAQFAPAVVTEEKLGTIEAAFAAD